MHQNLSKFLLIAAFILPAVLGEKKCSVRTEHGPGLEVFEENCVGGEAEVISNGRKINLPTNFNFDFPGPEQILRGPLKALEKMTEELPIAENLLEDLTPEIFNEERPEPEILDPFRLFGLELPSPLDMLRNLERNEDSGEIQRIVIQPRVSSGDLERKTEEAEEKLAEVEDTLEGLEKEAANKLHRLEVLERF